MIRNILFDLDGTLTDPREGIVRSVLFALERMGRELPLEDSLDWVIGPPLQQSLGSLLNSKDETELARCLGHFRERFSDIGLFENNLYPEIPELLDDLKSQGYNLFVATSKPKVFADRILEHFDLKSRFQQVYGSGLDGTKIEKAEVIGDLIIGEAIAPKTAIMVGDREHDVFGAKHHGIACIGVLYGYGSREELVNAGAIAVCETPSELPSIISFSIACA
jgi:phosphoglycolate phosphatase